MPVGIPSRYGEAALYVEQAMRTQVTVRIEYHHISRLDRTGFNSQYITWPNRRQHTAAQDFNSSLPNLLQ
jgi:hypothetical protein